MSVCKSVFAEKGIQTPRSFRLNIKFLRKNVSLCMCVCVSMDLEFCVCASGLNGCMNVCVCVCGFLSVVRVRLSIQPKCVYYLQLTYSTYIAGPLLAPCQPFPFSPIPLHNLPFPFPWQLLQPRMNGQVKLSPLVSQCFKIKMHLYY